MNRHFIILGHCNVSLGIILDSLFSRYGHGLQVDIISNIPAESNQYSDLLYLHDKIQTREFFYDEWKPTGDEQFILSGMSPSIREKIYQFFLKHFGINDKQYVSVIHKSAIISHSAKIEGPVLIAPGVVVGQYVRLEKFVLIAANSVIAHHTEIKEFTSVLLGSNIAGMCRIGKKVNIGMGTNVFDEVSIGDSSIIGGGSLVVKSIPEYTVSYGSPAKVTKKLTSN